MEPPLTFATSIGTCPTDHTDKITGNIECLLILDREEGMQRLGHIPGTFSDFLSFLSFPVTVCHSKTSASAVPMKTM